MSTDASASSSTSAPQVAKPSKSVRFAPEVPASSSASTSSSTIGLDKSPSSTLFSLNDEGDEDDATLYGAPFASEASPGDIGGPGARHAYGLKSTLGSREAEYDAASDTYSDDGRDPHGERIEGGERALLSPTSRRGLGPLPLPTGIRQSVDHFGGNMSELRRNVLEGLEGVGNATGLSLTTENGELPDWLKRGAGVFDATTNMANSILGAGIVGLPYSMKQSGFVAGVVLLVGIAMLTDWTIRLIILNSKLSGRQTYIEIMEHCFGRPGKAAVSLFQLAFAYGGMCAFCVSERRPEICKMGDLPF